MDLLRNRPPHGRPNVRSNDIAIVRLIRLQTSIFQKRVEKVDKNIQIITEKIFPKNPKTAAYPYSPWPPLRHTIIDLIKVKTHFVRQKRKQFLFITNFCGALCVYLFFALYL